MKPTGTAGWMHYTPYVKKRHIPPIFSASFALQLNTARDPHGDRTSLWAHFPSLPFFHVFLCSAVCLFFFFCLVIRSSSCCRRKALLWPQHPLVQLTQLLLEGISRGR